VSVIIQPLEIADEALERILRNVTEVFVNCGRAKIGN